MKSDKYVVLGDYVEYCDERNTDESFQLDAVRGISIEKKMIPTKANMDGVSLKPYKLFKPEDFCFVPVTSRNGNKITISMNYEKETHIVSSAYEVFRIKDKSIVLPDYLFLLFSRPEFDRYARFHSWGTARESFSWQEMCRVEIPLPSIEEQRKVVNAWKALREIKEQNETLAEPLKQVCNSFLQELKHKYTSELIGPYIERVIIRNSDNQIKDVYGVSTLRKFITASSSVNRNELSSYKVVKFNELAYVPTTHMKVYAIAISEREEPFVISPIYEVFKVNDTSKLLPMYLFMMLNTKEAERFAYYNSWGSARENFIWEDMKTVRIPIPPIEVQESIVNLFNCANEAKRIAEDADKKSREICPALIQHIKHL